MAMRRCATLATFRLRKFEAGERVISQLPAGRCPAGTCGQAGLEPGVPHFTNRPLAPRQRTVVEAGFGHLMNFPLASRQGAAFAVVAVPAPAMSASEAKPVIIDLNMTASLFGGCNRRQ